MLAKANIVKVFLVFLMLALPATTQLSYADWSIGIGVGDHHDDGWDHHRDDHRYYGWHDRPHWGYHMHYLPPGGYTIWVGGVRYYYYDGLYYSYAGDGDYVVINPPMGAYVTTIPPDFQQVNINGRIYYTNGGVYYLLTEHHGFKVVPQPMVYVQPQTVVVEQPQQAVDAQGAFPVNIPNGNGSFTTVVIRKSGNGFVGPQGEFYATFPSVAQLKAMYAK